MLLDEIKDIKSSKNDLKKFGLTLGTCFLMIGVWWIWKARDGYRYFLIISAFFLILAFFRPVILRPVQKIWMTSAVLMGWVITRVLLGVVFYLVITPISLIARILGKKFLDVQFGMAADSYWLLRPPTDKKKEAYEKQY